MSKFINEVWLPVVEWEGYYEVSNYGRIRSVDRVIFTVRGVQKVLKGKIISPANNGHNSKDYLYVMLKKGCKQYKRYVHRLVSQAFISNPENKPTTNHKDGDKQNNNLDNLEWLTYSENSQHAIATGLIKTKISPEDAKYIREVYVPRSKEYGGIALAKRFGVSINAIQRVVKGETHKAV